MVHWVGHIGIALHGTGKLHHQPVGAAGAGSRRRLGHGNDPLRPVHSEVLALVHLLPPHPDAHGGILIHGGIQQKLLGRPVGLERVFPPGRKQVHVLVEHPAAGGQAGNDHGGHIGLGVPGPSLLPARRTGSGRPRWRSTGIRPETPPGSLPPAALPAPPRVPPPPLPRGTGYRRRGPGTARSCQRSLRTARHTGSGRVCRTRQPGRFSGMPAPVGHDVGAQGGAGAVHQRRVCGKISALKGVVNGGIDLAALLCCHTAHPR